VTAVIINTSVKRINYTIKHPELSGRASFAILKVTLFKNGKRSFETVENDRIEAINHDWKNSKQSDIKRNELLGLIKEIRSELHKSQQIKGGKTRLVKFVDNQKILNEFISERIEDRPLTCPESQICDFTRAVLHIDRQNLSLKTASKKELQKAINKIEENNIHRRICSRINSLLGFIGRRERLEPLEYVDTPFIFNEDEFLKIVENIHAPEEFANYTEDIRNLYFTLFYTGMRVGEAFALVSRRQSDPKTGRKMNFLLGNQIALSSQMQKKTFKITKTKTGKERITYVIQNHINRIKAWAELDRETKEKIRKIEYSRLIKKAACLAFPKKFEMKRIKAHDCRHSYAVYLLNSGVSISLIAKSMGNSVLVCEKYYLGYALQEEGIQMIHNQLQR
jgi:integrase